MYCLLYIAIAASLTVGERLDQALQFSEGGRSDIAQSMLEKMADETLTLDERATVLYNLATIHMHLGQYNEALSVFSQIEPAELASVATASPLVALSIQYNRAVCRVLQARQNLLDPGLFLSLDEAELYARFASALIQKGMNEPITVGMLLHLFEEIAAVRDEAQHLQFSHGVLLLEPGPFVVLATDEMKALFENAQAWQHEPASRVSLYIEDMRILQEYRVRALVSRAADLLQKKPGAAFLKPEFEAAFSDCSKAFSEKNLSDLLRSAYRLLLLFQSLAAEDVSTVLKMRVDAIQRFPEYIAETEHYIFSLLEQYTPQNLVVRQIVEMKRVPVTLKSAQYDLAFWNLFSQPLEVGFQRLLSINPTALAFHAVESRLEVEDKGEAAAVLKQARQLDNPRPLILKSWFLAYPEQALSYWAGALSQEYKQQGAGGDLTGFLALFREYVKNHEEFTRSLQRLTAPASRFDTYMNLFWLHTMLKEGLIDRVQNAKIIQQDIQEAFRYAPSSVSWIWEAQKQIADQFFSALEKAGFDEKKAAQLHAIFVRIQGLLKLDPTSARSSKVLELLDEALKILQAESVSPAPQKAEPDDAESKEIQEQLKKKFLNLSPETSIRLLQMMEQDDARLFDTK